MGSKQDPSSMIHRRFHGFLNNSYNRDSWNESGCETTFCSFRLEISNTLKASSPAPLAALMITGSRSFVWTMYPILQQLSAKHDTGIRHYSSNPDTIKGVLAYVEPNSTFMRDLQNPHCSFTGLNCVITVPSFRYVFDLLHSKRPIHGSSFCHENQYPTPAAKITMPTTG